MRKRLKPNMVVSSKLREGDPAVEIVAEVKDAGFDIIVVGHCGLGRVRELFWGILVRNWLIWRIAL